MAETSTMLELGTRAPAFDLEDVRNSDRVTLDRFKGAPALLVVFLSRHCPYVKHIQNEFARLANEYVGKGAGVVAICSNDAERYPDDGPASLREMARELDFRFPYLFDESQDVARAYSAACTPDFFLFDGDFQLVYRGQFDSSRPRNDEPVTGADLRAALDSVLAGEQVSQDQRPSMGCGIKWKEQLA